MSKIDEKIAKLEFHMELLLKNMNTVQYPFDTLIIKNKLSREDVTSILNNCEELSIEMKKQKAEGFVTFFPLLHQFQCALHPNLPLEETILALKTQGIHEPLMREFLKLIRK